MFFGKTKVALWNEKQPNIKTYNVYKEWLVEDEYHFPFTCFAYSAIREAMMIY